MDKYVWIVFSYTNKINIEKIFTNKKDAKKYLQLKMLCLTCTGHYYIKKYEIFEDIV